MLRSDSLSNTRKSKAITHALAGFSIACCGSLAGCGSQPVPQAAPQVETEPATRADSGVNRNPNVLASAGITQVFADGGEGELQTMVETTFELKVSPARHSESNERWTLTSKTADHFDCSHLITAQTEDSVTLLLPGDVDARCADELILHYSGESQPGDSKMLIRVVSTPGRVTNFVEVPGNPQLKINVCPDWDCLTHSDPSLGQLPTGELAIWFAAGGDRSEGKPVVGRAVQKAGSSWVLDDGPVMSTEDAKPSHWDVGRETPSVKWIESAKAWDMWYLGYRDGYHVDPAIGKSRSLDSEGTKWERAESPIYRPSKKAWDGTFLTSPGALLGSDGVWRCYYVGANTTTDAIMRVGILLSKDGVQWTPYKGNPVFEGINGRWDYNILDTHVQFVGGRYVMWYTALAGQLKNNPSLAVGVAVSEDGFDWQRLTEEPIIASKAGWTSRDVLDVEVLPRPDGTLLLVGYAHSTAVFNPDYPDFKPGRVGLWVSSGSK